MNPHSRSKTIPALVLAITVASTGCSAEWLNIALQDLPILTQMALNIATLVSTLAAGQQASAVADPWINWCAMGSDSRIYALEVCDAVEADELGYMIDGVLVSDFITPAWYEPTCADRLDFGRHVSEELELVRGGYISVFDPSGGWTQVNARGRWSAGCSRQPPPKKKTNSAGVEAERALRSLERRATASSVNCLKLLHAGGAVLNPNPPSSADNLTGQSALGHKASTLLMFAAYASFFVWLLHSFAVRSFVLSLGRIFHRFLLKG